MLFINRKRDLNTDIMEIKHKNEFKQLIKLKQKTCQEI